MGGKSSKACVGTVVTRNCNVNCPNGWRSDGTSCWEDAVTRCDGGVVTRPSSSSCPNGWRNDGTSCWEDAVTTCSGGVVTRDAPRTCPNGTEFDDLKLLCYPRCREGYHKNPGDIVSCWNNKPTTKMITGSKVPRINLSF